MAALMTRPPRLWLKKANRGSVGNGSRSNAIFNSELMTFEMLSDEFSIDWRQS